MKLKLLLPALLISAVALGQAKKDTMRGLYLKCDTCTLLTNSPSSDNYFNIGIIAPIGWVTMGDNANNPIFTIDNPKEHKGNYIFHIKRYKFHWLNDSTAIYMPNVKKPVKKIKHFKQLSDGSFYLKELKPGETAILTTKIKLK